MLLVINEKGDIVIISRQNMKGGPALKGYPLDEDPDTGQLGHKLGYCPGCNNPLLIRTLDMRDIVAKFGTTINEYEGIFKRLKPKTPFRHKVIRLLGGKVD